MESMYYIGLDVHKKTISYCVKDASGQVLQEGKIGATRGELDGWMKTLPQPWSVAMEATIFTGWIYDHLLPHAECAAELGVYLPGSSICHRFGQHPLYIPGRFWDGDVMHVAVVHLAVASTSFAPECRGSLGVGV